jgi:hypothetical protein
MCTSKNASKLPALRNNPTVALTIDTEVHPPKILLIRGWAERNVSTAERRAVARVGWITHASTPPRHTESVKSARKCPGGMSRTRSRLRPRSEHGHTMGRTRKRRT